MLEKYPRTTIGYLRKLQAEQLNLAFGTETFFSSGPAFQHIDELDPNSNCTEKPFPCTFQKGTTYPYDLTPIFVKSAGTGTYSGKTPKTACLPPPPCQTPIYIYIYIYIYMYMYSHTHSHNHFSCRLLELPSISHRQVVPTLLDPVGPRAA